MDDELIGLACDRANAARWQVPRTLMAEALERGVARVFAGRQPSAADLRRHVEALHLQDLALACACAAGNAEAWDHFVLEYRPVLYRAADAINPAGGAREAADALYAELFGLKDREGHRASLFRYFHGRSSLATWLRSILAQRYVDQVRANRRTEVLPEEDAPGTPAAAAAPPDPDARRFASAMRLALPAAVAALDPRDRLRLGCYYAEEMTLAQIGRLTREHEATVSRQLARTRRAVRDAVEQRLRDAHRFSDREIDECFASVVADAGDIDLARVLGDGDERKKSGRDRSNHEDQT